MGPAPNKEMYTSSYGLLLIAIITDKQKSIKFRMTISQGNNSEKKTKLKHGHA